ncbi:nuclease-related domain-containing protein [Streptomyces sp. M10(2022)]
MTFLLLAAAAIAAYYYLHRTRTPRRGQAPPPPPAPASSGTVPRPPSTRPARKENDEPRPSCHRYGSASGGCSTTAPYRAAANVDHLVITLFGVIFVIDTKRWNYRFRVSTTGGRLLHGTKDVTDRLDGLRHEARTVAAVLGRPVIPIVVIHGAPIDGGELMLDGIRIVPADRLVPVLKTLSWKLRGFGPLIGWHAARTLPPYTEQSRAR